MEELHLYSAVTTAVDPTRYVYLPMTSVFPATSMAEAEEEALKRCHEHFPAPKFVDHRVLACVELPTDIRLRSVDGRSVDVRITLTYEEK